MNKNEMLKIQQYLNSPINLNTLPKMQTHPCIAWAAGEKEGEGHCWRRRFPLSPKILDRAMARTMKTRFNREKPKTPFAGRCASYKGCQPSGLT
jgi:hypothetical protein